MHLYHSCKIYHTRVPYFRRESKTKSSSSSSSWSALQFLREPLASFHHLPSPFISIHCFPPSSCLPPPPLGNLFSRSSSSPPFQAFLEKQFFCPLQSFWPFSCKMTRSPNIIPYLLDFKLQYPSVQIKKVSASPLLSFLSNLFPLPHGAINLSFPVSIAKLFPSSFAVITPIPNLPIRTFTIDLNITDIHIIINLKKLIQFLILKFILNEQKKPRIFINLKFTNYK